MKQSMISLHHLITDDANLVEYYITPLISDENKINIKMKEDFITKVKQEFKNYTYKSNDFTVFFRNELSYIYDVSNDNQFVYSKYKEKTLIYKKKQFDVFGISYKNSKLPTYVFPCLDDINYKTKYNIYEIKLSNRVNLVIKKDDFGQYLYIEYKHSPQVDIEKIDSIINKTIDTIFSII